MKTNDLELKVNQMTLTKLTLIRPVMTSFKMIVRADCAVSACGPLPPYIKDATTLSTVAVGQSAIDRRLPCPPDVGEAEMAPHQYSCLENAMTEDPGRLWPRA